MGKPARRSASDGLGQMFRVTIAWVAATAMDVLEYVGRRAAIPAAAMSDRIR